MGRDKASLPSLQAGEGNLLARTVTLAAQVSATVLVIGRDRPPDWSEGAEDTGSVTSVTFLRDDLPGLGPAGGLATALRYAVASTTGFGAVALLPCDLPLLQAASLRWLHETAALMP
ncbi:MAG: NTP transferase domain-containing protein, partial [Cytophagales bacterium]|nr:NTP transferase domain-containing protein [Armatimonadota bacterium]